MPWSASFRIGFASIFRVFFRGRMDELCHWAVVEMRESFLSGIVIVCCDGQRNIRDANLVEEWDRRRRDEITTSGR